MEEISTFTLILGTSIFLTVMLLLAWIKNKQTRQAHQLYFSSMSTHNHPVSEITDWPYQTDEILSESYLYDIFWTPSCMGRYFVSGKNAFEIFINKGNSTPGLEGCACAVIVSDLISNLDGYTYSPIAVKKYTTQKNLPFQTHQHASWICFTGNKHTQNLINILIERSTDTSNLYEISLRNNNLCIRSSCVRNAGDLSKFFEYIYFCCLTIDAYASNNSCNTACC